MDTAANQVSAQVLQRQGILPQEIIESLVERANARQQWLGQLAVDEMLLTEEELAGALASELKILPINLQAIPPDFQALALVDIESCWQHLIVPVAYDGTQLLLAMANPLDHGLLQTFQQAPFKVIPRVANLRDITAAIKHWYGQSNGTRRAETFALPGEPNTPFLLRDPHLAEEAVASEALDMDVLLNVMLEQQASDLHITVDSRPYVRIDGILHQLHYPVISSAKAQELVYSVLTDAQIAQFELDNELDLDISLPMKSRFRVNVFRQRGEICAIFRAVPTRIPTLESLGMPSIISTLAQRRRGLILVTGPTGTGKTTTLASMLHEINLTRRVHIVTIEDPIEFVHKNIMSEINQRQIGRDTATFAKALRHVLRQDPDVILIGEMRDPETISAAISAAETGHLVLSTLHTNSAAQTIDRIIDVFPPHQQHHVRGQLANILEGIITQVLVNHKEGKGRTCAQEILVVNDAVRHLIRENKIHQIPSIIQTSEHTGMQTMDNALKALVLAGKIALEEATALSTHPDEFVRLLNMD